MNEVWINKLDLRKPEEIKDSLQGFNPEEKENIIQALNTYREERNQKEKLGVLYLTHEELQQLKNEIRNPDRLNEFLENQLKETITTSEILSWTEIEKNLGWSENLEKFTRVSEKVLYDYLYKSNNALFKGIWLNEDAKRNLVVWFNFFIFDYLSKSKDAFNIQENISLITNNISSLLSWDISEIWNILNVWEKWWQVVENLKTSFSWLSWKLSAIKSEINADIIQNGWENNSVFMNPAEWQKFFSWILDGSIVNVQQYVIDKNIGQPIVVNENDLTSLKNIWNEWWKLIPESLWNTLWNFSWIFEKFEDYKWGIKTALKQAPDFLKVLWELESMPIIGWLISFIADLLWISNFKEFFDESQFWDIKSSLLELFQNENTIIHKLTIPDNFMKKGSDNDIEFLSILKKLWGWNNKYNEILSTVLKKGWDFEKFSKLINKESLSWNIQKDNELDYKNFKNSLDIYSQYIEAKRKDSQVNIEDFITSYKAEKEAQQQAIKTVSEIPKQESFQKTDSQIKAISEVQWNFYEITWNKNWEMLLKSDKGNITYSLNRITWSKKIWIEFTEDIPVQNFFNDHWNEIDINTAKGLISILLSNKWEWNNFSHEIIVQKWDNKWAKLKFDFNCNQIINSTTPQQSTENTWTVEQTTPDEIFDNHTYIYKEGKMEIVSPFTNDNVIKIIDEDGEAIKYKLNYKNSIDWVTESWNWESEFIIHKEWDTYVFKNKWLWIKENLKDLYKTLSTWINSVDIQSNDFFGLELEKVTE